MNLETWISRRLESLHEKNLFRSVVLRTEMPALHFCSNDYLGLSQHAALKRAAIDAVTEFGTGSGASRLISGTLPMHQKLEEEVAAWIGKPAALTLNSGYNVGLGVIPAISDQGVIFSDELNHACLIDGCRLSRAKVCVYRHGDLDHLETLLKANQDQFPRWIVSESVFGMEGEKADLVSLVTLKNRYGAALFLDEAHGIGVYGKRGRGWAEECGVLNQVELLMGTFGKACGSFGSFVVGTEQMTAFLQNTVRSFIFTTSLPPAIAAVNRESIRIVERMEGERTQLRQRGSEVRSFLRKFGFEVRGDDSPIIPVILGEPERALRFSRTLLDEGIWVQAIRPPTVPRETSRVRITLSASHTKEDCDKVLRSFEKHSMQLTETT